MSPLVFMHPDSAGLGEALVDALNAEPGDLVLRRFPDGESFVRIDSTVWGRDILLAWRLDRPDDKVVALYLLAQALREQGARRIILVAPYLPYMRQDVAFHPGETVSARHFAHWLSNFLDGLVTMDPHLHRIHQLDEVYTIPNHVVPAAPAIAAWIRDQVPQALLIGPDEESAQWVAEVADLAQAPHLVLQKTRHGDRHVEVSVPEVERWQTHIPVLVDDIISTARTMIATIDHLKAAAMSAPVCVGVHAIFAGDAYTALQGAQPAAIVSCNTIAHPSNQIDIGPLMAAGVDQLLGAA